MKKKSGEIFNSYRRTNKVVSKVKVTKLIKKRSRKGR